MINLIVALPSEARPLIKHFRLAKIRKGRPFACYETLGLRLCVSGVGKVAAATAVGFLAARDQPSMPQAWLNVGIAGHKRRVVGEPCLGHKVTDAATGEVWYPPFVFNTMIESDSVTSVDAPASFYHDTGLVDMEASGFLAAANRFATSELIHVLKVVSDNETSPAANVDASLAEKIITNNLKCIGNVVEELRALLTGFEADDVYYQQKTLAGLCERWRFSVTQTHRLERLLQRYRALTGEADLPQGFLLENDTPKRVLDRLNAYLIALPVRLGDKT